MTALELVSFINHVVFVGLFLAALWHALRQPGRLTSDTALLLGAIASVLLLARLSEFFGWQGEPWLAGTQLLLLNTVPFAMLRLVEDMRGIPRPVAWAGAAAYVVVGVLGFVGATSLSEVAEVGAVGLVAAILYFLAVGGYAAVAFTVESRRTRGITRRRMAAVSIGAFLFIGGVVVLFLGQLVLADASMTTVFGQLAALLAGAAFFLGFVPPTWIRRAWREPDLRAFLERSIHLTREPDERRSLLEIGRMAADAFGASGAALGLADEERGILRWADESGWNEFPSDEFVGGQAFTQQRRVVALDAEQADPEHAEDYRNSAARTIIAAPVTTDSRRLGVLAIYADRSPIFVEDDLWLLELLADQTAVVLEARELTAHLSEIRAREAATRLKEEFLSAAAHDLRTPLTVVLGQAELLERRLQRNPEARVDAAGVARMTREARRLRDLVTDLLDVQRLDQARAVMDLAPADLRDVLEEVRLRYREHEVPLTVAIPPEPVAVAIDRARIEQTIDNLVDNALKYGAEGESPEVRLETPDGEAAISVIDRGIGIPEPDRERIFERFFRGSNAHSITDTGIGLGLYICRRIVEEHGGRIEYVPTPGGGSTFRFTLPLLATADAAEAAASPSADVAAVSRDAWGIPQTADATADA
jgi:signal transduction histidine kinase